MRMFVAINGHVALERPQGMPPGRVPVHHLQEVGAVEPGPDE
jgi:hypothetical protein